jgi:hypothetical protein
MKTTSYNAEKEIRIGILVAVFAISIFTAVRVKELQLNDATNADQTRTSQILINKASIPSLPTLDARLIEEPVPAATLLKSIEYKAAAYVESEMALERERFLNSNNEVADAELAIRVKPWMSAAEYKATDYANADMALENERFLNSENEAIKAELALEIKSWMTAAEYKAADYANAEMALENERFFSSENDAIEPELANQVEPSMTATEYKAADYANAEMASERFFNDEDEAIEPELALQVKQWMTAMEYKATDYANAEMTLESEKFLHGIATANNEVARAESAERALISAIE